MKKKSTSRECIDKTYSLEKLYRYKVLVLLVQVYYICGIIK